MAPEPSQAAKGLKELYADGEKTEHLQKVKLKRRDQKKLRQYQEGSRLPRLPSDCMDILLGVHRVGTLSGMGGTRAISTIPSHADKEFWKL